MTVSLVRHLHRNVTKPILRAKHDLLRSVGLAKPSRSAPSTQEPERPAAAESTNPPKAKPTASSRTKADLYEEATRKGVEGRSKMTKAELAKALGLD